MCSDRNTSCLVCGAGLSAKQTMYCSRDCQKRRPLPSPEELFWRKVDRRGPDECWPWTGILDSDGYGRASDARIYRKGGKTWPRGAHVLAWEYANGRPVPRGLVICHSCDFRRCCNPRHLWAGTHRENMADRDRKGRQARGGRHWTRLYPERVPFRVRKWGKRSPARAHGWGRGETHGRARLAEAQVRDILSRLAAGERQRDLAREYGVDQTTLSDIERGKSWTHLRLVAEAADRKHGNAKLTDDGARGVLVRLAAGEGQVRIARELGVSQTTVSRIKRGAPPWDRLALPSDDSHLS